MKKIVMNKIVVLTMIMVCVLVQKKSVQAFTDEEKLCIAVINGAGEATLELITSSENKEGMDKATQEKYVKELTNNLFKIVQEDKHCSIFEKQDVENNIHNWLDVVREQGRVLTLEEILALGQEENEHKENAFDDELGDQQNDLLEEEYDENEQ
jgi:viroplasmin and RNaseH domain-containing protein